MERLLLTSKVRFEMCHRCNLYYRVFYENIQQEKVLKKTLNTCNDYKRVELNIGTLTEKKGSRQRKKKLSIQMKEMEEEWRRSILVPTFKNKGDVQSCTNYRGIKLMSHTMKLWERVSIT